MAAIRCWQAGHFAFDAPDDEECRPNQMRMLFLDPHTRELYRDWESEAAIAVASLRYVAGQFPEDRRMHELIGELNVRSEEFAHFWIQHTVQLCTNGTKLLRHPEIGDLELDYEALHLPQGDGQRFLTYSAAPDSSSHSALQLLLR